MAWLSQLVGRNRAALDASPFTAQDDPDWSDTSSESQDSVLKSDKNDRPRDGNRVSLEQERALLPYMPALLHDQLPPCGLYPQVAYENVIRRLRKIWFQRAVQDANNVPVVEICNWILQDLRIEAEDSPPGTECGTKQRQPWRREDVFRYEICWTQYFVREAEVLEMRATMSEEELEKQDFRDKLHPIPKELDIYIKKSCNKKTVLDSWKAWHQMKRRVVLSQDAGFGVDGTQDADVEDGHAHFKVKN